jgi:hypothetical protein
MKKLLSLIMLVSVLVSPGFVFSQAEEPEAKKLSLKDAIFYGLKNNLDLQIQKTTVQSNWQSLRIAKSIFVPSLNVNYDYNSFLTPSADIYDGVATVEDKSTTVQTSINQMLPTGGNFSFGFYTKRTDTNSLKFRVDPTINTYGGASLTQPLLKNFGVLPTK